MSFLNCSQGEIALVGFIFLLVYGANLLPRLGNFIGDWFADRAERSKRP